MKAFSTQAALVVGFIAALAAGVTVGMVATRWIAGGARPAPVEASSDSLAEQLGLSGDQRQDMRKIWSTVRDLSDESYRGARAAQSEKESAIAALIPAAKADAYRDICRRYAETCAALEGRRQAAFDKAVEETRKILSEPQREKYNAILRRRLGAEHGPREHDPTTEPASVSSRDRPASAAVALNHQAAGD